MCWICFFRGKKNAKLVLISIFQALWRLCFCWNELNSSVETESFSPDRQPEAPARGQKHTERRQTPRIWRLQSLRVSNKASYMVKKMRPHSQAFEWSKALPAHMVGHMCSLQPTLLHSNPLHTQSSACTPPQSINRPFKAAGNHCWSCLENMEWRLRLTFLQLHSEWMGFKKREAPPRGGASALISD